MKQKRLVTIQDISCFGKCSLTVALPVISTLGIETVVLPTAVLSTHTGEFEGFTFHPLYDEFDKIQNHWRSLNLSFDAIYVGYIGSESMIDSVCDFIDHFRQNAIVFVDPVMADGGKFYSGLDKSYAKKLLKLCKKADIISPNYTEALILSGNNPDSDIKDINEILQKLRSISKNVIITGIPDGDTIHTASLSENGDFKLITSPHKKGTFYGSGDLFASALIGMYTNGIPLDTATNNAAAFVSDCIEKTLDEKEKSWYGLKFEHSLGMLNLKKGV